MREVNGPEFTTRFNEYRAAQINGLLAPGFSTRQGMRALEEVFAQTMPRDMGFDYSGMSFQEQVASQGVPATAVFGFSVLVVFLLMAALYESWTLPFAVLLATPIAMFGRSEEHTSELQSRLHLVCRLLLEKKKNCGRAWADSRRA